MVARFANGRSVVESCSADNREITLLSPRLIFKRAILGNESAHQLLSKKYFSLLILHYVEAVAIGLRRSEFPALPNGRPTP